MNAKLITPEQVEHFKVATKATHIMASVFPPTFQTCYRQTEFEWLAKMNVDMRQLLHAEQEYEYFAPMAIGVSPFIVTKVKSCRDRRTMQFLVLETRVECQGKLCVLATTTFVVKK